MIHVGRPMQSQQRVTTEKWDGQAAIRIVDVLTRIYAEKTLPEVLALGPTVQQHTPMGTFD